MALEVSTREYINGLTSVRSTDRKRSAETLKTLLCSNALPKLLTDNYLKRQGCCWNELFDSINEYILKETEKFESSKNFDSTTAPLCTSLLHICVTGSIAGEAYVKCEKITEACLFILRDKRLAKAIGDAYLQLLYKHVLPCRYYTNNITPAMWDDLLEECIKTSNINNCSKLDDLTKMKLIWLVLKNGRNSCMFIIPVRNNLSKLKKCFLRHTGDKKVQDIVIEIIIQLLEMLSTECRLTMSEFMESILSSILKYYDQNLDQKKKSSLFKLLQLTLKLHHPRGRCQNEEGSLANDWDVWNRQLQGILEVVFMETAFLQRSRKQWDSLLQHCTHFYNVAASVYFQIFNMQTLEEHETPNTSKRQKITFNKNKTTNDLIEELRQNHVPWMGIIHVYVELYGRSINASEYINLINTLEFLLTNYITDFDWNIFEGVTCLVLKNVMTDSSSKTSLEDKNALLLLWNSCVRNCSSTNASHTTLHAIMQYLLNTDVLTYNNVHPLLKLYFENGMPVTNSSVHTLSCIFFKYFTKCCCLNERIKCLVWLTEASFTSIASRNVKDIFLRLISNENIKLVEHKDHNCRNLYDILFNCSEDCLLFIEFEIDTPKSPPSTEDIYECYESNAKINEHLHEYLKNNLGIHMDKLQINKNELLEFMKFVNIVIIYIDIMIKYNFVTPSRIKESSLFSSLRSALVLMCMTLNEVLKDTTDNNNKITLVQYLQDILALNCDQLICKELRSSINEDFFHSLHKILSQEVTVDNEIIFKDDKATNPNILKHTCICFLAVYCKAPGSYREQLLSLVLDPKLYDFNNCWDVECAFQCFRILFHPKIEESILEMLFSLLQNMCKALFKNSMVTLELLKVLLMILDTIWQYDSMRQNCFIMVKGFLQRSDKLYYPPHVAALVYECVAEVAALSQKYNMDVDNYFREALLQNTKGDVQCLRIYCCYMLQKAFVDLTENELDVFVSGFKDIFTINICASEKTEIILKDESANRSLTMFHGFFALALIKKYYLHRIIVEVLQIQKDKSLNQELVRRILNKITNTIIEKALDAYLNTNILSVLYYWFLKNNKVKELSIKLFGINSLDAFLEKHTKWLIAADVLCRQNGNLHDSEILRQIQLKAKKPKEVILEICFCNIIILCLPYIVTQKYNLEYMDKKKQVIYKQLSTNANKLFQMTRQVLENEKWSNLFVKNMGDLIFLTALHMRDHVSTTDQFGINVPENLTQIFHYPKSVFLAILQYFGILIEDDIMKCLCESHPTVIFNILLKLWENVLEQNILEYRALSLHTYITFLESIPLDFPSDAFVCNFTCNSISQAIKISQEKGEVQIFAETLRIALNRFLPVKVNILRKSISTLLSILIIKKEEGFDVECVSLFNYLTEDMKDYLNESQDIVDFVNKLSQGIEDLKCSTIDEFTTKLKTYKFNLICPSHETLSSMIKFLKMNKKFVNNIYEELPYDTLSDIRETRIGHEVINALTNILKSPTIDDHTKIKASRCLSEIGSYDMKTLVTTPPENTNKVIRTEPKNYFISVVVASLVDVIFAENPSTTEKVIATLSRLFMYRDGQNTVNSDFNEVEKHILNPFSSVETTMSAEFKIDNAKFGLFKTSNEWIHKENESHLGWLTRVTTGLLDIFSSATNYINSLRVVCTSQPSVCRKLLPSLVGLLLECSSEQNVQVLSAQFKQFFKNIWDISFKDKTSNEDSMKSETVSKILNNDHKMVIKYVLEVANFIRLQRCHYKQSSDRVICTLNYLKLEYDQVAWAATLADQLLAAIYYGELWAVLQNDGVPPLCPEATTRLDGGVNLQRILRKCYVAIGEMDAIDGCGTAHLTSENETRKHLINTCQYSDALLLHDIALSYSSQGDHSLQSGVVMSLHKSGMHHLALQYIKSLPESEDFNDVKYECMSFLGDWNEFVDTRSLEQKTKLENYDLHKVIKGFRYACLRDCLNLQKTNDFENKLTVPLNRAKLAVAKLCQNLNLENCQSIYKVVEKLHLFTDIEDYFAVRCDKLTLGKLLNHWGIDKLPSFRDFKHLEALMSQRSLILDHASKSYNNFLSEIVTLKIQYAELALRNQRIQMAQRLLATVKKLQSSKEITVMESQIAWAKGQKDIALSLLRNIVDNPSPDVKLTAISLRRYGLWMAETKCDNVRDIINKYLKKSLEVLSKENHAKTRLKVYYDIAKFADVEYKQVVSYMNSSVFENKLKCMADMKNTASSLKLTQQSLTKDERRAMQSNAQFSALDESEIANTKAEKDTFLHLAMRYYLLSLEQSEENNLSVFRVISLWLDNPWLQLSDAQESTFEDHLQAIPSRKFITVLPQLMPRLTTDNNRETAAFSDNLQRIIKRCAVDHPHHTLPILFSLKNSDKDQQLAQTNESGKSRSIQRSSAVVQEPRVIAAGKLVRQLSEEYDVLAVIIAQMETLCDAVINFANYLPKTKDSKQNVPSTELISKLRDLDAIPIPTVTVPLKDDCDYSFLSTLASFEKYFELVGGINCPKKILCRSSNGQRKTVLVKGEDDLRQDAVMQQVFTIVNTLLENNPLTNRKKLLIRTYKVVPMSRRSGVLQWCEGTIPLGFYLVGNNGAHARYRPQDMSCIDARKKLQTYHEARKSNVEKLALFVSILKKLRPAFHYFFTEHYLDPVSWYERRLAYTKSVATSSMVGYILGLGDRHVQNILIDKKTAEVIHIDFGIAFDQGKTLPTPETIPFRLTQDMVAGFGCSGVEGMFRRCCENTMQLLRDNSETLLTILTVLLCDPLYTWTVTSKQQNVGKSGDAAGNQASGSRSGLAESALLRVSSKLSGTEGGAGGGVAVPGQVARLITAAADPANLCRLFPGWQPYL